MFGTDRFLRASRPAVAAIVLTAVALPAATADGARRPTTREARSIRAAALRTLHGGGWGVSHIRVSTVRSANRYASAVVTNRVTGVGGSMVLATSHGSWRRRFLGTDGFCDILSVPHAALVDLFRCPDVHVSPTRAAQGSTVTVTGHNWPAGTSVEVLLGPPRSEADPVGSATASSTGRFTFSLALDPAITPGRYVVLGCQDDCRSKAGVMFSVVGAR